VRRPGAVLLAVTAAVAAQALPLSFAAAPGGAAAFRPGSAVGLLRPGPAPLVAQEDGGEEALRDLVASIARSWSRGDADGVLSTASEDGVRLQLLGGGSGRQSRRRAAAVLRRLLAENEGGRAGAGMVSVVGGSPPRGFGELLWQNGAPGTPGVVRTVVYLGFRLEDGRWRLNEIRLL
jgi:hypothetical protein